MNNLRLGEEAPNFTAESTLGKINFHDWLGDSWGVLFSHPKDFTPVCATELGQVADLKNEFAKRNCKVIGLSVDSVEDHLRWMTDIENITGSAVNFPLIGDDQLEVAKLYQMLPAEEQGSANERTAATNSTVRSVFIIGPDKKIKLIITYPMTTGRNFQEVLRTIDSMQLTQKFNVATPAGWNNGEDVIIVPSVSDEEAKNSFENIAWVTPYFRKTKQPILN